MKSSVRLLDTNTLLISDAFLEYLTESSDFLVIGCIGPQWSGKSTLMSHLARPPVHRPSNPTPSPTTANLIPDFHKLHVDSSSGKSHDKPSETVFRVVTEDHLLLASHATEGVHAFINDDRVIFLDCQPVQSMSVLAKMCLDGSLRNTRDDSDYLGTENEEEILSLQLAAFILSVSHVVLIIQDTPCDPEFIRFILTAEMLKPVSSIHQDDEENKDYMPQIMIVHNKAKNEHFSRDKLKSFQEMYKEMFSLSNLQLQTGMGIANGNIMVTLSPSVCGVEPINLFLLPSFRNSESSTLDGTPPQPKGCFKGHLGYSQLVVKLRQQLFGVTPQPLTYTSLTEKNWWHFAVKMWDDIKKSPYFLEYGRLLPTPTTIKSELSPTT